MTSRMPLRHFRALIHERERREGRQLPLRRAYNARVRALRTQAPHLILESQSPARALHSHSISMGKSSPARRPPGRASSPAKKAKKTKVQHFAQQLAGEGAALRAGGTHVYGTFDVYTPSPNMRLEPLTLSDDEKERTLRDDDGMSVFLQRYILYPHWRLSKLRSESTQSTGSIHMVVDADFDRNRTHWRVTFARTKQKRAQRPWRVSLQIVGMALKHSMDITAQSTGSRALDNLIAPEILPPKLSKLNRKKRHPVFMGVGSYREMELFVAQKPGKKSELAYIQIQPRHWDQVARHNKSWNIPTYAQVSQLATSTLYYPDVPVMAPSWFENQFGKPIPGFHHTADVAFMSGVRLERARAEEATYDAIAEEGKPGMKTATKARFLVDDDDDDDARLRAPWTPTTMGTDYPALAPHGPSSFDSGKYAELVKARFALVLKRAKEGGKHVWTMPFGLGVYAEAVASVRERVAQAWVQGIAQAADEADATGGVKSRVHRADFARFVGVTAEMWARAGLGSDIANDVKDLDWSKDWVIVVPGDPVALPGNEAAIGWLYASGDPFSLSFLAYTPTLQGGKRGKDHVLHISPYHRLCDAQ